MWKYYTTKVAENVEGALIVFKEFSRDWRSNWSGEKSKFQKGWHFFYAEENIIGSPEFPIRIAQLTPRGLDFGILTETL